ncbi:hypothetical protein [Gluconobacter cadivus]|uniref:Uncharacterized protein n=2 Tax=Gluconobacter TaxID=441 RepID=A0ABR9YYY1_9PROT|nr:MULTISPECIES: hypothetical protein [Gluconobacter]MBF0889771.1 hypothetical protein [Gluconobacter cadivus]MBS1061390.1 hypothetical protein [Gluconobacter sp. Dm-44]
MSPEPSSLGGSTSWLSSGLKTNLFGTATVGNLLGGIGGGFGIGSALSGIGGGTKTNGLIGSGVGAAAGAAAGSFIPVVGTMLGGLIGGGDGGLLGTVRDDKNNKDKSLQSVSLTDLLKQATYSTSDATFQQALQQGLPSDATSVSDYATAIANLKTMADTVDQLGVAVSKFNSDGTVTVGSFTKATGDLKTALDTALDGKSLSTSDLQTQISTITTFVDTTMPELLKATVSGQQSWVDQMAALKQTYEAAASQANQYGLDGTQLNAKYQSLYDQGFASQLDTLRQSDLSVQARYQTATGDDEGGFAGGIAFGGLVADLYAQSPDPGTYQIQRGGTGTWIRLGTRPVYGITVDAVGSFPSGATPQNVLDILRTMLLEDFVLPEAYIDAQWPAQSPLAPWRAGWFWDGTETVTGQDVVRTLLSGLAVSIVPTRSGTLRPVLLAATDDLTSATLTLDTSVITDIQSVSLDASLSPPTWRWRMGWQHNFTVQTAGSGLHPQAPADRQALIAIADRNAVWSDASLRMRWRVPNDPTPIVTALAASQDAQTVADLHGSLWGAHPTLWAVTIPLELSWQVDLGDTVTMRAPVPGLANSCLGVVVAEHVRAGDATATLQILTLWNIPDGIPFGDFGPNLL